MHNSKSIKNTTYNRFYDFFRPITRPFCGGVRIHRVWDFWLGVWGTGLGDGSPPAGSRGRVPVGGLGDEVPQKLTSFLDIEAIFHVKAMKKTVYSLKNFVNYTQ